MVLSDKNATAMLSARQADMQYNKCLTPVFFPHVNRCEVGLSKFDYQQSVL